MADVALRPTFPAAELERLRQERLTALLQTRDDPAGVATPAFWRVVYGAAHRYGTNAIGTTATLTAFTTAAAARVPRSGCIGRTTPPLIVVGDVTLAGVRADARARVRRLERGGARRADAVASSPRSSPRAR